MSNRPLRCAIYTRKSTEEGLEQDFNSLDAQREACAAYITSQRHEGWTQHPELYDDGGFSGGNVNRPGLQQLLCDIQAGKVDAIVVYKVDRLTRSLADFAKIVEILDAAGASFVSVTQAFNTTTSMGRLTLNVLLSFAQFEREVTGERIRDKIAASKARGMWMGGTVSMGYEVRDRKLHIVEEEANRVRHIFTRYLELGSVQALVDELDQANIRSRVRVSRTGRTYGGARLGKGALYCMLRNRIYIGEVVHKGQAYPGEHRGIIDAELFQQIQGQLEQNRVSRRLGEHAASPSLLIGIVYDGLGRKMSPDHASKGERKFRYYASRRDTPEERQHPTWRVPAVDLEEIVVGSIANLLRDRSALLARVQMPLDSAQMQLLFDRAEQKATELHTEDASVQRQLLWDLITRVAVDKNRIIITPKLDMLVDDTIELNEPKPLTIIARILRAGKRTTIMVPASGNVETTRRDASLIRLIATAASARKSVEASTDEPKKIAAALDYDKDYFARLVRIGYLAPDITSAILEGRQPRTLTRQHLARLSNLPISWKEQRQLLGFAIS